MMQWNLQQKGSNQIENYNVRVKFTVMLIYLLKELQQFRQIQQQHQIKTKKQAILKICVPFNDRINEIENRQVDNAKDLGIKISMYKLLEHSDNFSKILDIKQQYL